MSDRASQLIQQLVESTYYEFPDEDSAWNSIDKLTRDKFNDYSDEKPKHVAGGEWIVKILPGYEHQTKKMDKHAKSTKGRRA